MNKSLKYAFGAVVAVVSILGTTGPVPAQDCDAEPLIGDHTALSGTLASNGVRTHRGVELVIKYYNEGTHPLKPTP